MKHVDIYTDGACRGNPGKGGWGAILRYNGHEKQIQGDFSDVYHCRLCGFSSRGTDSD